MEEDGRGWKRIREDGKRMKGEWKDDESNNQTFRCMQFVNIIFTFSVRVLCESKTTTSMPGASKPNTSSLQNVHKPVAFCILKCGCLILQHFKR